MCNLTRKIERIHNASLGGVPYARWQGAARALGWEITARTETKSHARVQVVRLGHTWSPEPRPVISVAKLSNRRAMLRAFQVQLRMEGA